MGKKVSNGLMGMTLQKLEKNLFFLYLVLDLC